MIFWLASYPKSGNTWLRTLISSYYYSKDGIYTDNIIKKIGQFPEKRHFTEFEYDQNIVTDTTRFWLQAQKNINKDKQLRFFKTHNAFGALNNQSFTNKENSIGCIYIVRDPRNVITSLKNHYEMNDEQALKWMTNEKQFIYDVQNLEKDGYSDFQFISSWVTNYKSWIVQKQIPFKLIRYESLLNETYAVFKDIIEFINKTSGINKKIDKERLKNSVQSTSFNKLKDNEKKHGFSEAILSKKTNEKIPFFFLGPENDWKKILTEDMKIKLSKIYENNLKELSYL
ncbi:sulfotransferase domain-containing protein [Candidatus Pelagibacter sp.]|jgi:hypothetical protein|nr:sulfotransferase domain-containing protein [Candidatus Pelagibacter sp.]MDB3895099.1 sulfotransferase domain-containing protein [Candidatus Pelagibacter sp.]|tara:strand:- start:90 stop:944 length:855 start_codon:yes stop_codon:yes gene_type:complete